MIDNILVTYPLTSHKLDSLKFPEPASKWEIQACKVSAAFVFKPIVENNIENATLADLFS